MRIQKLIPAFCALLFVLFLVSCKHTGRDTVALLVTPPPPEPLKVQFAGVAFLGDWNQRDNLYPYSAKLLEQKGPDGGPILDAQLVSSLQRFNNENVILDYSPSNNSSIDGVSLAFAISNEQITSQSYRGKFLTSYQITSNILTFDFSESKIIGNFPITVRYAEILPSQPTEERKMNVISAMYLNPVFSTNIFRVWVDLLNSVSLKRSYRNYIQLTDIRMDDETIRQAREFGVDPGGYSLKTAQLFESALSSNQLVPILPFTKGEAIANRMSARFSNAEVFSLKLPEPDYSIELEILPFRKKDVVEQNYIQTVYGGKVAVRVFQPDTSRMYLNGDFWKTAILTRDRSDSVRVEEWEEYDKVLSDLLDQLTQNISARDSDWLENSTRTPNVKAQLKAVEEVLSKTR